MDPHFWHQRWEKNEIGFHEMEANPHLVRHFHALALPIGSRVFLPLCGKTLDIAWLLGQGHRVAGAELSEFAIEQLFRELGMTPQVGGADRLNRYSAPNIDIFVGDIFDLTREMLGAVDAVYDRAALVALPPDLRKRYAAHLTAITGNAPQLLVSFDYEQALMEGPPFSMNATEVRQHYSAGHEVIHLDSMDVPGGLKGKCPATEHVWLLR